MYRTTNQLLPVLYFMIFDQSSEWRRIIKYWRDVEKGVVFKIFGSMLNSLQIILYKHSYKIGFLVLDFLRNYYGRISGPVANCLGLD